MAVEDRSEATLLPIIKDLIKLGSLIVSDCWKSYHNLHKHGHSHHTVNHSKKFVNKDGYNTNKMEGHWQHMKVNFSCIRHSQGQVLFLSCGVHLAAC